MESAMFRTVLLQRSLAILLVVAVSLYGVTSLRCYKCENAQNNDECNKNGTEGCQPTMDTCQTIVAYSDVSEKLAINKICTVNLSCAMQMNETSSLCQDGMTTSSGTSVCTKCCGEDTCNVSKAPHVVTPSHSMSTLLLVSFAIMSIPAVHSLDDVAAP